MDAFKRKKFLVPKIESLKEIKCEQCTSESFGIYFDVFKQIRDLNNNITKECGLKPLVLKIVQVLTPALKFKDAIVLTI